MSKYRVFQIVWDIDPQEPNLYDPIIVDVPEFKGPMSVAAAVQKACGFLPIMAEYEEIGAANFTYDLSIDLQLFSPRQLRQEEIDLVRYNLERMFQDGKEWVTSNFDRPFDQEVFISTPIFGVGDA